MWNTKMYILGYEDLAMEPTALIDIPGALMTKDDEKGLRALSKDCGFNEGHNFNLVIMPKLFTSKAFMGGIALTSLVCQSCIQARLGAQWQVTDLDQ